MLSKKLLNLKQIKELKLEVLVKMSDLAIAGFGLVAALAWNSAIQALFAKLIPADQDGGLIAQIFYAILVTVIVVAVTLRLSRMTTAAKDDLDKFKSDNNLANKK
jgi:hypothetical protein